jgi:pyrimidine operon attenuation protein / uracil phosphoribosyltransferase
MSGPPWRFLAPLALSPFVFPVRAHTLRLTMRNSYDQSDVGRMIEQLVSQIAVAFKPDGALNIVGIRTRGETLAQRLTAMLQARGFAQIGRGVLDITLYRDDLSEIGPRPLVRPTHIDIDINGRPLLLVDDVLFTGRSIRAALDALSDFGRPSAIRLVVIVDRGGRELPIQADFVGLTLRDVPDDHRVNVRFAETDGRDEILVEPR